MASRIDLTHLYPNLRQPIDVQCCSDDRYLTENSEGLLSRRNVARHREVSALKLEQLFMAKFVRSVLFSG